MDGMWRWRMGSSEMSEDSASDTNDSNNSASDARFYVILIFCDRHREIIVITVGCSHCHHCIHYTLCRTQVYTHVFAHACVIAFNFRTAGCSHCSRSPPRGSPRPGSRGPAPSPCGSAASSWRAIINIVDDYITPRH